MVEIGQYNKLKVVKSVDFGLYLDGGDEGEILLPKRYVPADWKVGEEIEVFLYTDSEDRLIATTEKPKAVVGEFACLEVVATSGYGAFLDWGLSKDLLVPFSEQKRKMRVGDRPVVAVYLDEVTDRVVASSKIKDFLSDEPPTYKEGDEVELMVYQQTPIGMKAIINDDHSGVIYRNEVFHPLKTGDKIKGYIKKMRPDGKIDLILQRPGMGKIDAVEEKILNMIKKNGGAIPTTDKSPAEEIYERFGVSKKTYKKAIGALYKKRLIILEKDKTRLA